MLERVYICFERASAFLVVVFFLEQGVLPPTHAQNINLHYRVPGALLFSVSGLE